MHALWKILKNTLIFTMASKKQAESLCTISAQFRMTFPVRKGWGGERRHHANMKLTLAVFDKMCYNKMNYADNTARKTEGGSLADE